MAKLVGETLALVIEKQATNTTQRLSGQELDLGLGILGVYETSRVHLDFLEINGLGTDSHSEFLSITGAVVAVGGRELPVLRAMLLEKTAEGDK